MKKGSIIPELQNRVTHYDVINRVTNSKVLFFLIFSKSAQDLLKFGTCDISNIAISILMSKIIFIKSLPVATPKLVPN